MNTQPNPTLRIAIIGGGAAGYFAAIEAKRTPSLAASTCKPHGLYCGAKYCEVIYLEVLGAGGRGAEATVLLGGRIRLDKIFTRNNILSKH